MSRHDLGCRQPDHVAVVGWDNPLSTFFAEVLRVRGGRRTSTLWLGSRPREINRAEDLVELLAPFAVLDDALLERLRRDRANALDNGPTRLQRLALEAFAARGP